MRRGGSAPGRGVSTSTCDWDARRRKGIITKPGNRSDRSSSGIDVVHHSLDLRLDPGHGVELEVRDDVEKARPLVVQEFRSFLLQPGHEEILADALHVLLQGIILQVAAESNRRLRMALKTPQARVDDIQL